MSRYEWQLADAISDVLDRLDVDFTVTEQWPVHTKHFIWHFDLWVEIRGKRSIATVIEVNGVGHETTAKRDELKFRALPPGVGYTIVPNDDCRFDIVSMTAGRLLGPLIYQAIR